MAMVTMVMALSTRISNGFGSYLTNPSRPFILSPTGTSVSPNASGLFKKPPFDHRAPPTAEERYLLELYKKAPEEQPAIMSSKPLHESKIIDSLSLEIIAHSTLNDYSKRCATEGQQYSRAHALAQLREDGAKVDYQELEKELQRKHEAHKRNVRDIEGKMELAQFEKKRLHCVASKTKHHWMAASVNKEETDEYLERLQEFAVTEGFQKPGATWSLEEACESCKMRPPNIRDDAGKPLGLEDIDEKRVDGCTGMLFALHNRGFYFNHLCEGLNTNNMGGQDGAKARLALLLQFLYSDILDKFGNKQFQIGCTQVLGESKANELVHELKPCDGTRIAEATVDVNEFEDIQTAPTSPSETSARAPIGFTAEVWEHPSVHLQEQIQERIQ
jgi:hypothetical protein